MTATTLTEEPKSKPKMAEQETGDKAAPTAYQYTKLLANCLQLMFQAKCVHWNARSPIFLSLHPFMGEVSAKLFDFSDQLAEIVRTLDFFLPAEYEDIKKAGCKLVPIKTEMEAKKMLEAFIKNLDHCAVVSSEAAELAEEIDNIGAANTAAEVQSALNLWRYQLKSMLAGA